MSFDLIDRDWQEVFDDATDHARNHTLIVVPFLRRSVLERLLGDQPKQVKVITRFNLDDFNSGVSDINAFEYLLAVGAQIKGVKNLHAKVYVFGKRLAIVTSANLTEAALWRNAEFGVRSRDKDFVSAAMTYFEHLWQRAKGPLEPKSVRAWKKRLASVPRRTGGPGLGDFGADLALDPGPAVSQRSHNQRHFVKFFGKSNDRAPMDMTVRDEVERSGSHWALSYGKRPRQISDGDEVFIARLAKTPSGIDIMVYGVAVGYRHRDKRDVASAEEIRERSWKRDWPYYVRIREPVFVDGTLGDCPSLYELMNDLGPDTFVTTKARALAGEKDIDPRSGYQSRPGAEMTNEAADELRTRLHAAFDQHGRLTETDLDDLDWPTTPLS